ncbi:MAG TPA: ABC transporter permease, partial [Blastocatellia bacterium]|nr:ABC transporter permease [Blastocatellia bacterium]
DWRQEWEAELRYREELLAEWDRLDWPNKLDLLRRSVGAFRDALLLQPRRLEDEMFQDIRFGARMMLKNPGFTLIAALTLALGIGANSAIFSVANALLLRPLPFEHLDRLVALRERLPNQGLKATAVSPADFHDWRKENTVFQEVAAYRVRDVTLTEAGEPELARGAFVSADFFAALELKTVNGRALLPEEDQPGRDQVAVLGHGLWRRRFGGDPNMVGATITINGRAVTVVGVLPPAFDFPFGAEVWLPLALTPEQLRRRETRNLQALARLKPGASVAQAQAEMRAISQRLEQRYPQTNAGLLAQVMPLSEQQSEFSQPMLAALIGMAALLLLIACANIANLLFARATTRRKEIAIRTALGAGRWRVLRQLLTESFLLSCLAGTLGLTLAGWAVGVIKASLPPDIARFMPGWKAMGIDGRVFLFTLGVACLATLIFSLLPALAAARPDLNEALKEGGKSSDGGARGIRARGFLTVAEIALALVLMVGAGLMVKGFWRILNVFGGADPHNVLTLQTPLPATLPGSRYADQRQVASFYQQVLQRLERLPGAQAVSAASNTPLNNRPNPSVELLIEGRPPLPPGERQVADLVVVSPNYFATLGARLLRGHDFNEGAGRDAPGVAIISELAARRYWPNEDPLGRRIRRGADEPWLKIVGVVSDIRQSWFDKDLRPQLYLPYQQAPQPTMTFLLRTADDPLGLAAAARAQIHAVDRDQPIKDVMTLAQLFVNEMTPFRFAAVLTLVFGALALILAVVGVYGVMSYAVEQRRHEIGVRMALGAQTSDVLRLIVGQGLKMAALGLAIGAPLAMAVGRLMASQLYGVVALEYAILFGLVLLLCVATLLSSYFPARRAIKVAPLVALRHE